MHLSCASILLLAPFCLEACALRPVDLTRCKPVAWGTALQRRLSDGLILPPKRFYNIVSGWLSLIHVGWGKTLRFGPSLAYMFVLFK